FIHGNAFENPNVLEDSVRKLIILTLAHHGRKGQEEHCHHCHHACPNYCLGKPGCSGPPATKRGLSGVSALEILASAPLVSMTLPAYASKITFSPARRSLGPQPWRRTVFGLVNSRFQLLTVPLASVTSMYTRMCGFNHSTFVTTPVNLTFLFASYSVSKPWCAISGTATNKKAMAAIKAPDFIFILIANPLIF